MANLTKPGRLAGGIIAILGGILLVLLFLSGLNFLVLSMGILGIMGGILLLYDWTFGGGLALLGGTMGYGVFLLFFEVTERVMPYILSAGLLGLGGFIGVMIGSQSPLSIGKSEFELIDDWIDTKIKEISEAYRVIKIEFFNRRWDGLVFLVEFQANIDPKFIKDLIALLEETWNRKAFLMTKAGLNDSEGSDNKYVIYQKDGGHLTYILEEFEMDDK